MLQHVHFVEQMYLHVAADLLEIFSLQGPVPPVPAVNNGQTIFLLSSIESADRTAIL